MTERKLMTGRELLNNLQAMNEEVLTKPLLIRHRNGGYIGVSDASVFQTGQVLLQVDPGPTEAEKQAVLKDAEDRLWAGSRVEEDGSVAVVDPVDLKKVWDIQNEIQDFARQRGLGSGGSISLDIYAKACSPGADVTALWYRVSMLRMLCMHPTLSSRWLHDGKPDDAVFNVAAKFPIKRMPMGVPQKGMPLDVEGFLKQIEEPGLRV